jgi:hypothetical protein
MYNITKLLIEQNNSKILPTSYYFSNLGIFIFGSKGTIFSKEQVNNRFIEAIQAEYISIKLFIQNIELYIQNLCTKNIYKFTQILTLHFEAISKIPTDELTIYYGKASCPFFGLTTYDDTTDTKKFFLPIDEFKPDSSKFGSVANVYKAESWTNINEIFISNYNKLLDGNLEIEPEGYVVHIFGENEEWIPIKYKYKIYYIAHKPESKHNLTATIELSSDSKYDKIRERLIKFRSKPSIITIIKNNINIVEKIKINLFQIIDNCPIITKKIWAILWKQQSDYKINNLIELFSELGKIIAISYDQICNMNYTKSTFNYMMLIHEKYKLDITPFSLKNGTVKIKI